MTTQFISLLLIIAGGDVESESINADEFFN